MFGFPFGFFSPWWDWPYYPPYGFDYGYTWPYYSYDPYWVYTPGTYTTTSLADTAAGPSGDVRSGPASSAPPAAAVTAGGVSAGSNEFALQGEAAFKARDYKQAAYEWRHAVIDDPRNGTLLMMLAQALFADGQYDQAAGTTQLAMQLLPQDKWGVVVGNYTELYTSTQDYVDQLKSLERAIKDEPQDPALRFLVGFHYGYLGYPQDAVRELDELLKLAPKDQVGQKLHDLMARQNPSGSASAVQATPGTNKGRY